MATPSALLSVQPLIQGTACLTGQPLTKPPDRLSYQALAEPCSWKQLLSEDKICLLGSNTPVLDRQAAEKHTHAPKPPPPLSTLCNFFSEKQFLKQDEKGREHKMHVPREAQLGCRSAAEAPRTAAAWL